MAAVKGTKQYPLKIVEDRPWRHLVSIVVALILFVAGIFASFYLGYKDGMQGQERARADVARLQAELLEKSKKVEELQQQVTNINLGAEVDRQASESVRQEVIALKDQLAKLEEDNSFYRNLMAPTGNKRGLTFGSVEIVDSEKPRVYNYKVVMQQLAINHQLLNGQLTFNVVGKLNGFDATFSLNQLSEQVTTDAIRLRFKYFQTIQGELSLPDGFEPERIELVAKSTGGNAVTIEKRFGWLVEEA